jgi:hypothetical protein
MGMGKHGTKGYTFEERRFVSAITVDSVDMRHPLVKQVEMIDWVAIEHA